MLNLLVKDTFVMCLVNKYKGEKMIKEKLVIENGSFTRESSISVGEYEKWSKNLKYFLYDTNITFAKYKSGKKLVTYKYNIGKESGFWCNKCNRIEYHKIHGSGKVCTEVEDLGGENIDERKLINGFMKVDVYSGFYCKCCKTKLIQIDPNIAEAIRILNKKGYKTSYCCESHTLFKKIDDAYILFDNDVRWLSSLIRSDLPFGWYIDTGFLKRDRFAIRAEYNDSKDYLFDLLKWAESLPYMEFLYCKNGKIGIQFLCKKDDEL